MSYLKTRKRLASLMLVFLLFSGVLSGGCTRRPKTPTPTTAAPYTEEASKDYEHFEEAQLKAQAEFSQLMEGKPLKRTPRALKGCP